MTNRSSFLVAAALASSLCGCGSVTAVAGDGGADQAADLVAPASDTLPENQSEAGAGEVAPEVGPPDASPAIPACARGAQMPLTACAGRPACSECLGSDFARLAQPGAPCAAAGVVCVSDCRECP